MKDIILIADIIKSKKIPDRLNFQKDLSSLLNRISSANKSIISSYTITLGDEFQAVYGRADGIMLDILEIMTSLYPVQLRVSLGIGYLETELNPTQALGMDGPPFHIARKGIDYMKKYESSHIQIYSDSDPQDFSLINRSLDLAYSAMKGWKKNTFTLLRDRLNGESVQNSAENLNISVRGVYKVASTNLIQQHNDLLICIEREINDYIKKDDA